MLQVTAFAALGEAVGIVTPLLISVWRPVGGASGVE